MQMDDDGEDFAFLGEFVGVADLGEERPAVDFTDVANMNWCVLVGCVGLIDGDLLEEVEVDAVVDGGGGAIH